MLDTVLEVSGLSRLQYLVLAAMARAKAGASGAWIARQCGISRQAAHGVLQVLEGRELVARQAARPFRARSLRFVASAWGTSRLELCSSALDATEQELAEHLSAEEIETLCRLMSILARALRQSAAQID